MAKKKYIQGSDGYYTTKAWEGSYNSDGTKHRITLRSKTSSADLEKQVQALKEKINTGNVISSCDITFLEYANEWLTTYKAVREMNTKKCIKISFSVIYPH